MNTKTQIDNVKAALINYATNTKNFKLLTFLTTAFKKGNYGFNSIDPK